jgi:GTP-binding protein Era
MARRRKPKHVSGFVSVLGRPNAGKSTLVNRLAGAKVAIVADKPQTTRDAIQAVVTSPEAQVVFIDTPGMHEPRNALHRKMMDAARAAMKDQDLLIWMADATVGFEESSGPYLELLRESGTPAILALNKIDLVANKAALIPLLDAYRRAAPFEAYVPLSAETGEGCGELMEEIVKRLPEGPRYFPEDHLTDQPLRFLAAEIIREKILHATGQEVPHSVAVLIEKWEETAGLARILAAVHVERTGQKAIVIGRGGEMLKRIGTLARKELQERLGKKVYLELFVKVEKDWRKREGFLKELDYQKMTGGDPA